MNKYLKRIISVILFLAISIFLHNFLKYILVDNTSSYTRIMMHEMYESDQNIDTAFVGSSHCYRSLVPELMDEGLGCYTFNAGSSSQNLDGSYALIKEMAKYNDIKTIYLEMYYNAASPEPYSSREGMTSTYIISDYMRPSVNKTGFLLKAGSKKHWINGFLPERRQWETLFKPDKIAKMLKKKETAEYRNFQFVREDDNSEYYLDRGFVANEAVVSDAEKLYSGKNLPVKELAADSDWYKSLEDIIGFCEKKNIKLVLFVSPMPTPLIVSRENYQEYNDFIAEVAAQNGLEFYDFNLCRPEYFDCNDDSLFGDKDHLNTKGAKAFSELFSKFFTGKISAGDLFYKTKAEKIALEEPAVYGLAREDNEFWVLGNKMEDVTYSLEVSDSEGNNTMVIDAASGERFSLPFDEGDVTIEWKSNDREEKLTVHYELKE